mmetsp:Transcript_17191/g.41885  ORF Transcript_17191/g.41885 Transcript_17191/m.41885 type:complete len:234 (+) Transcript_17191:1659-2360(+)
MLIELHHDGPPHNSHKNHEQRPFSQRIAFVTRVVPNVANNLGSLLHGKTKETSKGKFKGCIIKGSDKLHGCKVQQQVDDFLRLHDDNEGHKHTIEPHKRLCYGGNVVLPNGDSRGLTNVLETLDEQIHTLENVVLGVHSDQDSQQLCRPCKRVHIDWKLKWILGIIKVDGIVQGKSIDTNLQNQDTPSKPKWQAQVISRTLPSPSFDIRQLPDCPRHLHLGLAPVAEGVFRKQ